MFGVLYKHIDEVLANPLVAGSVKSLLQNVLGLTLVPLPEKIQEITPEIQQLLEERIAARAAKDWAKSDTIRDQLKALGYDVQDKKL